MNRRRFLKLAAGSTPILAGCSTQPREETTEPATDVHTATVTRTGTSPTPGDSNTIFVGPDGSDASEGAVDEPLASIQTAINRARPGETVHVLPGHYREFFITKRDGESDKPITIQGPAEAVIRPPRDLSETPSRICFISHSHIHLDGMTFNGLAHPEAPENPASYANNVIDAGPPQWKDEYPNYLTDVKIKPDAIGNARRTVLGTVRTNQLEIGEFRVIGLAGAGHQYADDQVKHPSGGIVAGGHIGEMVQIGAKHNVFDEGEGDWYQWEEPDESHDIHVHHIVNTAGHPHTELVELGTSVYDALIEYCTDGGGAAKYFLSQDYPNWTETSMAIAGGRCTLRWCIMKDGFGAGLHIGQGGLDRNIERYRDIPDSRFPGTNNAVYGNRIIDNAGPAIVFPGEMGGSDQVSMGPDDQEVLCGNEYTGETQGDPDKPCPDEIPRSDEIGYLGGDSPWA